MKKYKPGVGDKFYYILLSIGGDVCSSVRTWNDIHFKRHYENGNCFKNVKDAEDAKSKVIKLLQNLSKI